MNLKTLQHIARQTEPLEAGIVADLVELTKKFPFFAWPYAILARHYHKKQDFRTEALMHQAAMRIHDRTWLFEFVHESQTKDSVDSPVSNSSIDINKKKSTSPPLPSSEDAESKLVHEADTSIKTEVEATNSDALHIAESHFIPATDNKTEPPKTDSSTLPNLEVSPPTTSESKNELPKKSFVIPKPEIEKIPIKPKPSVSFYDIEKIYGNQNSTETETTIEGNASLDFYSWLNKSAENESSHESSPPIEEKKQHQLIEKFLVNKPSITKPKQEFFRAETAYKKGEKMSNVFVTETLASIYLKQDNPQKAIWAYEQLQLKFPEKKTYFANLIEQIKKEHLKS